MVAEAPESADLDLNAPEGVFSTKVLWQGVAWACMVVCLGIAGIAFSQLVRGNKKSTVTAIYGVMGLFGIGGAFSAFVGVRMAGQKYVLFPDRLVAYQNFRSTTIRWGDIREVYQIVHPAWVKIRVLTRSGQGFTITGEIVRHRQLGECIGERVAARLLPETLAELRDGRAVRFGPRRVSGAGVEIGGQFEAWHRIGILTFGLNPHPVRGTSILSNMIHVRIGGAMVEVGSIPNFRLFQELATRNTM
jgi:hypothetical protein